MYNNRLQTEAVLLHVMWVILQPSLTVLLPVLFLIVTVLAQGQNSEQELVDTEISDSADANLTHKSHIFLSYM